MPQEQKNNPLHGVKLEALLLELLDNYEWEELAEEINLNCFKSNPSVKSSLKFLRKFEWAREKVERFYLYDYKGLPRPGMDEFDVPPRKRFVDENGFPTGEIPTDNNYTPQKAKIISHPEQIKSKGKPSKSASLYGSTSKQNHTEQIVTTETATKETITNTNAVESEKKNLSLAEIIEQTQAKNTTDVDTTKADAIAAVTAILETTETQQEIPTKENKENKKTEITPKTVNDDEIKTEEKTVKKSTTFNPWANSKHVK